ncbi:MAG: MBL fold metallo-hydrolase [Gemmatimonadota bacterium]|nr:MBL fold metallo-hydrolase [Gemmatimonadota bacterium]
MTLIRRDFLASAGAAAAALTLGHSSIARALQAQQAQAVFAPIRRNVGYFTMRGGTIGYLVNSGAVVAVDSQFPAEAAACIAGLKLQSNDRPVDYLINTHHHGDHTGGNIAFRGVAKKVVAHGMAAEHMRQPPGGQAPEDQLYPDTTFADRWTADVGDERIIARHYGRAHTSGDAVITFERANVAHMGDLMFNQRHPVVDRAAGATLHGWMGVLDLVAADHASDTIYIFGHANTGLPITGGWSELAGFRDYIGAVMEFVDRQINAGRSREEVLAMRDPLAGFESYGRFGAANPRDILTCAYEEITAGG